MPPALVGQVSLPGRSAASSDRGAVTALTRTPARAGFSVLGSAGAPALAAPLDHPDRFRSLFGDLPVATPLCGGNADPALLR